MKKFLLSLFASGIALCHAQQNELNFLHQNINFSAAPRTTINPMSLKMWDNYQNGGLQPTVLFWSFMVYMGIKRVSFTSEDPITLK